MKKVHGWSEVYRTNFLLFTGSSLQQLSTHIPKLLHYASGLVFDNVPPPPTSAVPPSTIPSSYSSEHVTPHAIHTVRGAGSQVTAVISTHGEIMNLNQVPNTRRTYILAHTIIQFCNRNYCLVINYLEPFLMLNVHFEYTQLYSFATDIANKYLEPLLLCIHQLRLM